MSSRAISHSPTQATSIPPPSPPPENKAAPKPSPVTRLEVNPAPAPTFKDAKQTRDNIRPSRVGGGIFRPNGESKLFPTREVTPSTTPQDVPQVKPPGTFSELVKRWSTFDSPEAQWALLSVSSNYMCLADLNFMWYLENIAFAIPLFLQECDGANLPRIDLPHTP